MKKVLALSLSLLLPVVIQAQSSLSQVAAAEVEGLVDLSLNSISFRDSLPESYNCFFNKLDTLLSLSSGNLKIIHVGGSHVQAGVMTGRLRSHFLSLGYGLDGNFGLVFPYSAGRTNTPQYYSSRYTGKWTLAKCTRAGSSKRLGLMGLAVTNECDSTCSVAIMTHPRNEHGGGSKFNRLKIYGYPKDSLSPPPTLRWPQTDSLMVVDSVYTYHLSCFTDSVRVAIPPGFTISGMVLEGPFPSVSVSSVGVNGATTKAYLRCKDLERDLVRFAPDMVIFEIGINDAMSSKFDPELFKENYSILIAKARAANPDCAILFVTNNDSYVRRGKRGRYYHVDNPNGPVVAKAFTELRDEYDAGLWDMFSIMGGMGSISKWADQGYAKKDRIHFTEEGYTLLADLLFEAIMEQHPRCSQETQPAECPPSGGEFKRGEEES